MRENGEALLRKALNSVKNPRVSTLIEELVKDDQLSLKEAAETVYASWKEGTLELLEPRLPSSFLGYLSDLRSLWFWAVTTLVASTVTIVFCVSFSPLLYLRYVFGSFFVLYLPGSMLINALYPQSEDLESVERFVLSIGSSLAVVPLIGLLLNYTPWGIRLAPLTISLATFIETMAFTALIRKYRYYTLTRSRS